MNTKHIDSISLRFMKGILLHYYPCLDVLTNFEKREKVKAQLDTSPTNFVTFVAEVAEQVYGLKIFTVHKFPRKVIKAVAAETVTMLPPVFSSATLSYVGEEQCLCLFWASVLRFYVRFKTSKTSVTEEQIAELDTFIGKLRVTALAYHKCSERKVRELLGRSDMPI